MYPVTQTFKDYAAHRQRVVQSKVTIADVDYFDANIIDWDIEDSVIMDSDLQLGAVVSSHLNISLNTEVVIPNNAQIIPHIRFGLGGSFSEWLPMGVFFVDTRSTKGQVWRFNCFDRLIVTQQYYRTDLIFPNSMLQTVIEMSANLGLNVSEATLTLLETLNYQIPSAPSEEWSFRDVLGYIAAACGCNVKMNRLGEMEFIPHGTVVAKHISSSDSSKFENVAPFKHITQLICNFDSSQEPIIIGEGDVENALKVQSPYITEDIALTLFEQINGINYTPSSFGWRCEAYLDVGDMVEVESRGVTYATYILRQRTKYRGGLSSKIESPSSTVQQSEFQFGGAINQAIADVGKRIGLFAHSTNSKKLTIKQSKVQSNLMPITTAAETDIEFVCTLAGVSTVATTLNVDFVIAGLSVGRSLRIPIPEGEAFVSFSTLVKRFPKIADWLFMRLSLDVGSLTIEQGESEFYIYGGNIVSGDVRPILIFEDLVSMEVSVDVSLMTDQVTILKQTPINIFATDDVDIQANATFGLTDEMTTLLEEV